MPLIIPDSELITKPLNENYDLSSFYCINSDLNDFLKNDALSYHKNMVSKTSLCFWNNELVGYITYTIDSIGIKKVNVNTEFISKYSYPGLKIARLAIDSRFERRGIGRYLLQFALGIAWTISESASCRLVLVDSKKDSIPFYKKYGFKEVILKPKEIKDDYTPMYFDLLPLILKISSHVEGKGDYTANIHVLQQMSSSTAGHVGSSTSNIQLLDHNEKKE